VQALPREVPRQSRPQHAGLFGELADGAAEDGFHGQPGNVLRMLGEQVTEVEQELALARALHRAEAFVVDDRVKVLRRLPKHPGRDEVGDEVLSVRGIELEVATVDSDGGQRGAAGEGGQAEEEWPHAVVLREGRARVRRRWSRSAEAYMCQTRGMRDMPAARARSKVALRARSKVAQPRAEPERILCDVFLVRQALSGDLHR
jgi:hypothetical protein